MENVEGLARGVAFQYVQNIYKAFEAAGYKAKHWLFKGENMGIPQNRHRVIFIAIRNDIDADATKLDMNFNYKPILYKEIKSERGREITSPVLKEMAQKAQMGDRDLSYTSKRERGKDSLFNFMIQYDEEVCCTIPAKEVIIRFDRREWLGIDDAIRAQTFPEDYDFGTRKPNTVFYFLGMSVPPVMMKRIVCRLISEGVFRYKGVI